MEVCDAVVLRGQSVSVIEIVHLSVGKGMMAFQQMLMQTAQQCRSRFSRTHHVVVYERNRREPIAPSFGIDRVNDPNGDIQFIKPAAHQAKKVVNALVTRYRKMKNQQTRIRTFRW